MFNPLTGPNDPRLPNRYSPNGDFDPKFRGGPGLEGRGFQPRTGGPGQGNNVPMGLLSAFLPGQQNALAQQMQHGFGGTVKQWNGILGQPYADMSYMINPLGYPKDDTSRRNDHTGKGDGKGGGDNTGHPDTPDGFNSGHFNPSNVVAANAAAVRPGMQVQAPQMNVAGPAQPQMLGQQQQMSPPMIAMLRQRLMGGR